MVKAAKKAPIKDNNEASNTNDNEEEYILESAGNKIPVSKIKSFEKEMSENIGEEAHVGGFVRVQARVSRDNFEYIQKEAYRTGTNISAIASILIADAVAANKKREKVE